jgi:hypothetical protein
VTLEGTHTAVCDTSSIAEAASSFGSPSSFGGSAILGYSDTAVCSLCSAGCAHHRLESIRGAVYCPDCARLVAAGTGEAALAGEASTETEPAYGSPHALPTAYAPPFPDQATDEASFEPDDTFTPNYGTPLDPAPSPNFTAVPSRRPISPVPRPRSFPWVAVIGLLVLAGGGFLFWKLVAGRDRIDRLLAEADSSDRSIRLAPVYERGQSWRYRYDCDTDLQMEGTLPMLGSQSLDVTADQGADFYLDVLDVDAGGNAELQLAIEGVQLDIKTGDSGLGGAFQGAAREMMGFSDLKQLEGQTHRFRVNRRGRRISSEGGGVGAGFTQILLDSFDFEGMPDHDVKPGDTWEHTEALGMSQAAMEGVPGDFEMEGRYRFVGYAKHLGRDCAVLELTGDGEMEMGSMMRMEMRVKGACFLDSESSQLVHLAADMDVKMTVSDRGANLTADVRLEMDLKLQ